MRINKYLNGKVIISAIVFSAMILGGCVSGKQKLMDEGNKPLTGMELKKMFAEKQVADGKNSEGNSYVVTVFPDGTLSALGGDGKTYPGTYSFKGDQFCSKMDHRNFVRCTTWFKVGEKKYKLFRENESGGATLVFR